MIKVLNLYAGIGGNRKLWEDVEVTAVELNPQIAAIYQDFFPNDTVIVGDAHQFLLEHYDDGWDFIWSSPPCPTHSQVRQNLGVIANQVKAVYPDMKLWQEIIFLQHNSKCKYVVENVEPYYEPFYEPQTCGRHRAWSNFSITHITEHEHGKVRWGTNEERERYKDFDLSPYKLKNKRQILRNAVNPKVGEHILNCAFKLKQTTLDV